MGVLVIFFRSRRVEVNQNHWEWRGDGIRTSLTMAVPTLHISLGQEFRGSKDELQVNANITVTLAVLPDAKAISLHRNRLSSRLVSQPKPVACG